MCKLFLNLHIQKARRKHGHQQIYLFTHFKVHTLNKAYLLLTLNVTLQLLKSPKQKVVSFSKLNSFSIGMTLSFGSFLSWLAHFGPKIALTLEITFSSGFSYLRRDSDLCPVLSRISLLSTPAFVKQSRGTCNP